MKRKLSTVPKNKNRNASYWKIPESELLAGIESWVRNWKDRQSA